MKSGGPHFVRLASVAQRTSMGTCFAHAICLSRCLNKMNKMNLIIKLCTYVPLGRLRVEASCTLVGAALTEARTASTRNRSAKSLGIMLWQGVLTTERPRHRRRRNRSRGRRRWSPCPRRSRAACGHRGRGPPSERGPSTRSATSRARTGSPGSCSTRSNLSAISGSGCS